MTVPVPLPAESRTVDVAVVGELNVDLILSGDVTPEFGQAEKLVDDAVLTVGSSSAIFACGAARLGLRVAFFGLVGDDLFGRYLIEALGARGVDTSGVVRSRTVKTGLTLHLTRGVDRAMLTYSGSIGAATLDDLPLSRICSARHLHLGSYYLLDGLRPEIPRLFAAAAGAGLSVSLDTNFDPSGQWNGAVDAALARTTLFLPNEIELTHILRIPDWRAALEVAAERTPVVALTRGADGAVLRAGKTECAAVPPPVSLVDTTGAGDTFDAGVVYAYLAGWSAEEIVRFGVVCGALSTRAAGGTDAQPTLDEAVAALRA